ncbi:dienelactone hydrolase family protein [Pseudarthrobacter sp. J75]|uniref:alpha/beta hydrolase n=1 Tax=unclassified Pseudarthrobacter TaxID=2647000 RepID=UPI002E81DD4D|nr:MULTISPECIES: dienelactone hydrolase family protein [unclassified Pseudarthrobacter]MEE2523567.1 dienelactone hydrolase family protein [Pseudarthrobacter sp. J47]MEE2530549.1 dienelactone hydrolase family protein [Pseudarthrobacter sp. J75]
METVVWSKPESERAGTPLLVMLHGYGTDESRMERLFGMLPEEFTCAAPRAPMAIGDHFGWFLLDYFLTNDFADVISATNKVHVWINSLRKGHSSVTLLGYSQGMAMASTLLRLHPESYKAVVGLSGFVLDNELLAMSEQFSTPPPFFWGRDKDDLVINDDAIDHTARWLEANTALTARTYPGMGHSISAQEMVDVSAFLRYYVLKDA